MTFKDIRKYFTLSTVVNGIFLMVVAVFLFNPAAKALLIRGLMKAGFFQPDVAQTVDKQYSIYLPDFRLQNTSGTMINLQDLKGKVVLINFFATWCPPCIAEMPSLNHLREKLKDNKNIIFLMVDTDHNFSKSMPFMADHHFSFPIYEALNPVPAALSGDIIPGTVIFGKNGQLVFRHDGAADYSSSRMVDYLEQLAR